MTEMARRIGIMGGSFNPIHHGHLVAAQEAKAKFNLERIIFVPAYRNPFKTTEEHDHEMASTFHRYTMVELATSSNPAFYVSSFEIDREMPSYTLETLQHFREEYGESTGLYFITGTDAVMTMPRWNGVEQFHNYCEIIAVTRPSYIPNYEEFIENASHLKLKVYFITIPALEISSSDIRERIRRGMPIRYLTPTSVAIYIEKQQIYKKP
jgi:nicotinate-nucleotide adenylyltransferase